jgi:hypothetical protein
MAKSLLLPKDYTDPVTRSTIFYALKPYENPGTEEIVNPLAKWDLRKAWNLAEEALSESRWRLRDDLEVTQEYELAADTDNEIERANLIIAGIVAYQIMNPDSKIGLRRIEHKKGGEMSLIISAAAAAELKKLVPKFGSSGSASAKEGGLGNLVSYALKIFGLAKKEDH